MMMDAFRAEAWRLSKNRTAVIWSALALPIVFFALKIVGDLFMKRQSATLSDAGVPVELLTPPLTLGGALVGVAGDLGNPLLLAFVLIGAATVFAGDYRWETWRLVSARNSRANLILGKVGAVKLLTLAALAIMLVLGLAATLIGAVASARTLGMDIPGEQVGQAAGLYLVAYVRVVQVMLIGLLAAVATRSLLATLFVPLVLTVAQTIASQPFPLLGWSPQGWRAQLSVPGMAYDNLKAVILGQIDVSHAWIAATCLILWCVVPLALAILWFSRQDLSKE